MVRGQPPQQQRRERGQFAGKRAGFAGQPDLEGLLAACKLTLVCLSSLSLQLFYYEMVFNLATSDSACYNAFNNLRHLDSDPDL